MKPELYQAKKRAEQFAALAHDESMMRAYSDYGEFRWIIDKTVQEAMANHDREAAVNASIEAVQRLLAGTASAHIAERLAYESVDKQLALSA